MFDFPLPLRPVIELKLSSLGSYSAHDRSSSGGGANTDHPVMTVRTAYDLKPCKIINFRTQRSDSPGAHVYDDFHNPHGFWSQIAGGFVRKERGIAGDCSGGIACFCSLLFWHLPIARWHVADAHLLGLSKLCHTHNS